MPKLKWRFLTGVDFVPNTGAVDAMCEVGRFEIWVALCNPLTGLWKVEIYYNESPKRPTHTYTIEREGQAFVTLELLEEVEKYVRDNSDQIFVKFFTDYKELTALLSA